MTRTLLVIIFCASLIACDNSSDLLSDAVTGTVESGVSALSGVMDDHNGATLITFDNDNFSVVAACTRAAAAACAGSIKTATYAGCTLGSSFFTVTGNTQLTYSSVGVCGTGLSITNDSVTREYDYSITGPGGGTLRVFSTAQTDYRGNSISGGGRLTRTASGWNVELLGKNKVLNGALGPELINYSLRTTTPVNITGGITRGTRVANGGALEVIHNKSKFIATHTLTALTWSASCCHPVSGSIETTLSGSKTGTINTTFTGCGLATVTKDNENKNLVFDYCE